MEEIFAGRHDEGRGLVVVEGAAPGQVARPVRE